MSDGEALSDNPHPCQNCGSTLQGKYCCQCGQRAHVHRDLSAIGHDLAHGVLHIDGKIWNTLPLLLLKPGELTRRYIAGERVKFLSPMGLYLFSIFILFAVMAFAPSNDVPGVEFKRERDAATESQKEKGAYNEYFTEEDAKLITEAEKKKGIQPTWLDLKARKAFQDSEMLAYKVKSNGYKLAWLLIPLSLPFMWFVMIGRRGFNLYDHAVFVTYSISFMGLLAALSAAIGSIPVLSWVEPFAMAFIPPVHMYLHLKATYGLGWLEALVRLALLLTSVGIVIFLYAAILLFVGIL